MYITITCKQFCVTKSVCCYITITTKTNKVVGLELWLADMSFFPSSTLIVASFLGLPIFFFFVLWLAFSIIHGSWRATKNRNTYMYMFMWMMSGRCEVDVEGEGCTHICCQTLFPLRLPCVYVTWLASPFFAAFSRLCMNANWRTKKNRVGLASSPGPTPKNLERGLVSHAVSVVFVWSRGIMFVHSQLLNSWHVEVVDLFQDHLKMGTRLTNFLWTSIFRNLERS